MAYQKGAKPVLSDVPGCRNRKEGPPASVWFPTKASMKNESKTEFQGSRSGCNQPKSRNSGSEVSSPIMKWGNIPLRGGLKGTFKQVAHCKSGNVDPIFFQPLSIFMGVFPSKSDKYPHKLWITSHIPKKAMLVGDIPLSGLKGTFKQTVLSRSSSREVRISWYQRFCCSLF